jgi:hypothetical protein
MSAAQFELGHSLSTQSVCVVVLRSVFNSLQTMQSEFRAVLLLRVRALHPAVLLAAVGVSGGLGCEAEGSRLFGQYA